MVLPLLKYCLNVCQKAEYECSLYMNESGGMQYEVRAAVQHHPADFRHWRSLKNLSSTSGTGQCLWAGDHAGGTAHRHPEVGSGKSAADFLVEIMPVMFVPAGAGLITAWSSLKPICVPVLIMTFISTVIVMVVTGKVTQGVIRMGKRGTEK